MNNVQRRRLTTDTGKPLTDALKPNKKFYIKHNRLFVELSYKITLP